MKKKFQVIRGQKMQDQSILKLFKRLEILMYSEHSVGVSKPHHAKLSELYLFLNKFDQTIDFTIVVPILCIPTLYVHQMIIWSSFINSLTNIAINWLSSGLFQRTLFSKIFKKCIHFAAL